MMIQRVLLEVFAVVLVVLASPSSRAYASVPEDVAFDAFEFPKKERTDSPKYFDDYGHVNTHFEHRKPTDTFVQPNTSVLSHLFISYSLTMRDLGIRSWLAHGTLLSWYWNHAVFPWETDIDVHIALPDLRLLASYYNMTVYQFRFPDAAEDRANEYLLDINPNFPERLVGRHDKNRIDARWVDMSNGAYIDITALHLFDRHARKNGRPVMWQSKDGHVYHDADVYPLRRSVFQGVEAWVPADPAKISSKEYSEDALTRDVFRGYRFSAQERQWIAVSPQAGS